MEQTDILIINGTLLTMDTGNRVLEGGFLCIEGDAIARIGQGDETPPVAKKILDARGGLVLPGLVNGHTHASMTLFRGLADDRSLMEWLNHYIFPVESKMDADFVFAGARLACAEMILSGTTTFCDMYLFEDQVAEAGALAGMRCLVGEVLYDFPSPNYGPLEKGFEYTQWLLDKWQGHPLVSIAVEPHSLFTCSPELLQKANELALAHQVPLIVHVAETENEVAEIQQRYHRTPVQHLEALGLLGPHLIGDHCVHLSEHEIALLAQNQVKAIHNPESNMKLASGIAPIPLLLKAGITVGLGTDGCASNNNLDLFTEMDMAAKLHKVKTLDPTVMDAVTVFRMATIEGAAALGLSHITGSLEVGKKADVIVMDTHRPHLTPMYNPFSQVVYAARGSDVVHSIINGALVMENRNLLTLSLPEVLEHARLRARDVRAWTGG